MLDQHDNPYTPNAGARPLVLAGRAGQEQHFEVLLARLARGQAAQSLLVTGLRGVGKTVLLTRFNEIAEAKAWIVVEAELTKDQDFLAQVVRLTRKALLTLDPPARWSDVGRRAGAALRGLTMSVTADGGYGLSWSGFPETTPGSADSGDLAMDLTDVIVALGEAAREKQRGVIFLFDELQFATAEPLGAFITALHKVVQRNLPVTMVGAGLPMLPELTGQAKSYAERLFTNTVIGALDRPQSDRALHEPAEAVGVLWESAALEHVYEYTEGYPFFLQVYGSTVWRLAQFPGRITLEDVRAAEVVVRDELDVSFFRTRVGGLTDAQRRYLRALAEAREAEVPTGDVALTLGLSSSTKTGTMRDALIRKGLVYPPRVGYTAFTVPQFGDYMIRNFELEAHQARRRPPRDRRQQAE